MLTESVLQLINDRQSIGHLVEPAPSQQQIQQAIGAALAAPDHRRLHPWQFIQIDHDRRVAFGELIAQCLAKEGEIDPIQLERVKHHPLRAPLLLICVMKYQAHAKVPKFEQLLSCGAAIENLLLVLQAQGFASIWRTGDIAENSYFRQAMGCDEHDVITGIVYIGTAFKDIPAREPLKVEDFLSHW
ncbi:nitroreductase [Acinetobacter qingfengensis]|uniref:Putative NAD(P)H nitroreductase n=1 Tax=Acinetobacter qingfengensis TaxID=1262585 RepID=A0A1E7REW5_9GAMM|nr:nitroreductase [Acinetobacter qingfengensis]KAA8735610.1 nitroreductase [Acinetobacter qingfengensis]OEY97940.1 nitroreductase [Acinetobacter qingfengensis]